MARNIFFQILHLKRKKYFEDYYKRTIQIIDQGEIFSSVDHDITKDLFFHAVVDNGDNSVLLGSNMGIIKYSNGDFSRVADFDLIKNKIIKTITTLQNKSKLIICELNDESHLEAYIYNGILSKVEIPESFGRILYKETTDGDLIIISTESNAYLIKNPLGNKEVIRVANNLNDCKKSFLFDKKLYLICQDKIVTVVI